MQAIVELIRGLWITFCHLWTRHVTIQYPRERKPVAQRFRGPTRLLLSDNEIEKCVACCLCAQYCPSGCIKISAFEDESHNKRLLSYEIDIKRCIFCGLCIEACPKEAIKQSEIYELACLDKDEMVYSKETLIKEPFVQKYK
ncbi:MAG: NADH-quinone oxidoreductase subunit I [bacterium]